jgi:hypothetical protein
LSSRLINRRKRIVNFLLAVCGPLLVGCAEQSLITHVNQRPLFQPSLLSYGAQDGGLPLEIHGNPPAGMDASALAARVHLPGRSEGVRLMTRGKEQVPPPSLDTPVPFVQDRLRTMLGSGGRNVRLALIFNPHVQTLPDWACSSPDQIPSVSGENVRVMAAFCVGAHLAASGQLRLPSTAATTENLAKSINVLLSDMSTPPLRGGFDTNGWRF